MTNLINKEDFIATRTSLVTVRVYLRNKLVTTWSDVKLTGHNRNGTFYVSLTVKFKKIGVIDRIEVTTKTGIVKRNMPVGPTLMCPGETLTISQHVELIDEEEGVG